MVDAPPTKPVEPIGGFGKVSKGEGFSMAEAAILAQLGYIDTLDTQAIGTEPELSPVPDGHRRHIVFASAFCQAGVSKAVIGITRDGTDHELVPPRYLDGVNESAAWCENITLKPGDVLFAYDTNGGNVLLTAGYTDIKVRR